MRLERYLTEGYDESRMKEIPYGKFLELARENCMDAIISAKAGNKIYRGDANSYEGYYLGDARTASPRKSRNTSNHYTLWMDNHPSWSKYPKRSQSFICSTDEGYAQTFGRSTKLILPYNGVDIGVCLKEDLWGSFPRITFIGNSWDASDFNGYLNQIIQVANDEFNRMESTGTHYDKSWNILRGSLKEIDRDLGWEDIMAKLESDESVQMIPAYTLAQLKGFVRTELKKTNSLMDTVEYLLNPDDNGFELTNSKKIPTDKHEVWMEGPVLALGVDEADDVLRNIL